MYFPTRTMFWSHLWKGIQTLSVKRQWLQLQKQHFLYPWTEEVTGAVAETFYLKQHERTELRESVSNEFLKRTGTMFTHPIASLNAGIVHFCNHSFVTFDTFVCFTHIADMVTYMLYVSQISIVVTILSWLKWGTDHVSSSFRLRWCAALYSSCVFVTHRYHFVLLWMINSALQLTEMQHEVHHFRYIYLICEKNTNVAYLWFGETYNANVSFWRLLQSSSFGCEKTELNLNVYFKSIVTSPSHFGAITLEAFAMFLLEVQVNSTWSWAVSSFAKRTVELLRTVTLEGLTCQVKATPSSVEVQCSTTKQRPFTDLETTVSMVGFPGRSAKVEIWIAN